MYAGKLYDIKKIDLLIESFKKIDSQNVWLLIIGNGKDEKKLHAAASEDKRIIFQPFKNQTEMPWVYRMGDVFILPSSSETWGLAVNEAMASGRPVIVSDKCGCAIDLVQNGRNGYVFKSEDQTDLLEKMQLMLDKRKINEMGIQSKLIVQDLSIENTCCQIENIVLAT